MEKLELKAEKRTLFGKKAKKLRTQGLLLANIFGKGRESQAVMVRLQDFLNIYKKAHTTRLVNVVLENNIYPILIKNVQKNFISNLPFHADFRQVDLKEKTQTEVPVVLVGELDVIKSGEADALLLSNKITVECLPTDIPENITVDISKLSGVGAEVLVKDLQKIPNVTFMDEQEKVVVQIAAAKKEEIVAPSAEEKVVEAEVTTGAVIKEGEEGEAQEKEKVKEKAPKTEEKKS